MFSPAPDAVDVAAHTSAEALTGVKPAPNALAVATARGGEGGQLLGAEGAGASPLSGATGTVASAPPPSSRYALPPDLAMLQPRLGAQVPPATASPSPSARSPCAGMPQQAAGQTDGTGAAVATQQPSYSEADLRPCVHAWVLLQPGKRGVTVPTFVEPTTGRTYEAGSAESPYLAVLSAWNAENYYVNMQGQPSLPGLSTGPATLARLQDPALDRFPLVPLLRQALSSRQGGVPGHVGGGASKEKGDAGVPLPFRSPYLAATELDGQLAASLTQLVQVRTAVLGGKAPALTTDSSGGGSGRDASSELASSSGVPLGPVGSNDGISSGAPVVGPAGAAGLMASLPPDIIAALSESSSASAHGAERGRGASRGGSAGRGSSRQRSSSRPSSRARPISRNRGASAGATTKASSSSSAGAAAGPQSLAEREASLQRQLASLLIGQFAEVPVRGLKWDFGSANEWEFVMMMPHDLPRHGPHGHGHGHGAEGGDGMALVGGGDGAPGGGGYFLSPRQAHLGANVVLSPQQQQAKAAARASPVAATSNTGTPVNEAGGNSGGGTHGQSTAAGTQLQAAPAGHVASTTRRGAAVSTPGAAATAQGGTPGSHHHRSAVSTHAVTSPSAGAPQSHGARGVTSVGLSGGSGFHADPKAVRSVVVPSAPFALTRWAHDPAVASSNRDAVHVLDLPASWCGPLSIDPDFALSRRFGPHRERSDLFHRALSEAFPPRAQPSGLVRRHTSYADDARLIPTIVVEEFECRRDRLYKRVRRVGAGTVEDHFAHGKPSGLALQIDQLGVRRETLFYAGARPDGLRRRVHTFGRKVCEWYGQPDPGQGTSASRAPLPGLIGSASDQALGQLSGPADVPMPRVWYRSVSFTPAKPEVMASHGGDAAAGATQPSSSFVSGASGGTATAGAGGVHRGAATPSSGAPTARAGGGPKSESPSSAAIMIELSSEGSTQLHKMTERYTLPQPLVGCGKAHRGAADASCASGSTPRGGAAPVSTAAGPGTAPPPPADFSLRLPPPHACPERTVFNLDAQSITVSYHRDAGRVLRNVRRFVKAAPGSDAETLAADPLALPPPSAFQLESELASLLAREQACHSAARVQGRIAHELLTVRRTEEAAPVLETSLSELAHARAVAGVPLEDADDQDGGGDGGWDRDYLAPFIAAAKVADPDILTEKEARRVDKDVRTAHKERLLDRVAIIQRRLDEENEGLLRRQQAFSRSRDHDRDAEAEFEDFCAAATFRIGVLEARLARQERVATQRYQELEGRLTTDPRLAALRLAPAVLCSSTSRSGGGGGGRSSVGPR